MCDYSLHLIASRPAKVADRLVSTDFVKSITRGFTEIGHPDVAVCLLPGTELAFDKPSRRSRRAVVVSSNRNAVYDPPDFHEMPAEPRGCPQIFGGQRLSRRDDARTLFQPAGKCTDVADGDRYQCSRFTARLVVIERKQRAGIQAPELCQQYHAFGRCVLGVKDAGKAEFGAVVVKKGDAHLVQSPAIDRGGCHLFLSLDHLHQQAQ